MSTQRSNGEGDSPVQNELEENDLLGRSIAVQYLALSLWALVAFTFIVVYELIKSYPNTYSFVKKKDSCPEETS